MNVDRYRVMSIPGRRDDGRDTGWYVFDYATKRSMEVGDGNAARLRALSQARNMNRGDRDAADIDIDQIVQKSKRRRALAGAKDEAAAELGRKLLASIELLDMTSPRDARRVLGLIIPTRDIGEEIATLARVVGAGKLADLIEEICAPSDGRKR